MANVAGMSWILFNVAGMSWILFNVAGLSWILFNVAGLSWILFINALIQFKACHRINAFLLSLVCHDQWIIIFILGKIWSY